MTYEERYEGQFLARSFAVLERLLRAARALVGLQETPPILALGRLIRPAEVLLRRVLVVMALGLALVAPVLRQSTRRTAHTNTSPRTCLPGFSLIEPWPSTTPYDQRRPVCKQRPRIRSFDDTVTPEPSRASSEARLIARLDALATIISAPERAARRLAVWFARRRRGLRNSPLRIGRPVIDRRSEWAAPILKRAAFRHRRDGQVSG